MRRRTSVDAPTDSVWTLVTLEIHFQRQLNDLTTMLNERYSSQTKALDAAFLAQQTAVDKALNAAEKAVDQRASTLDREFHEHLAQVVRENELSLKNAAAAAAAALLSQKEAVTKAEVASEKRFESVNEFRAQLADQAGTFVSRLEAEARRAEADGRHTSLVEKLDTETSRNAERISEVETRLTSRMDLNQGSELGARSAAETRRASTAQIIAMLAVVLTTVSIAVAIILGFNN